MTILVEKSITIAFHLRDERKEAAIHLLRKD